MGGAAEHVARSRPYPCSCDEPILVGDLLLWEHKRYYAPSSKRTGLCSTTLQWVTLDGRWCVGSWVRCERSAVTGRPFTYAFFFGRGAGGRRAGVELSADGIGPEWVEAHLIADGYTITSIRPDNEGYELP